MRRSPQNLAPRRRTGATTVEMAVVLPVFFLFMFALVEFSHAYFVINVLNGACKKAARMGIGDDVTTTQVEAKVREILTKAMKVNNVTVVVKNAGTFDSSSTNPANINYNSLPSIELSDAEPRQLFIVRASVPYEDVSLIPPLWIKNITLSGQSVMRHE